MIQISFQLFVILISTDVLREIRRGVAGNLAKKKFTRVAEGNEANQLNRKGASLFSRPNWDARL